MSCKIKYISFVTILFLLIGCSESNQVQEGVPNKDFQGKWYMESEDNTFELWVKDDRALLITDKNQRLEYVYSYINDSIFMTSIDDPNQHFDVRVYPTNLPDSMILMDECKNSFLSRLDTVSPAF